MSNRHRFPDISGVPELGKPDRFNRLPGEPVPSRLAGQIQARFQKDGADAVSMNYSDGEIERIEGVFDFYAVRLSVCGGMQGSVVEVTFNPPFHLFQDPESMLKMVKDNIQHKSRLLRLGYQLSDSYKDAMGNSETSTFFKETDTTSAEVFQELNKAYRALGMR